MTSRPGQLERPSNVRTLSRTLATPGASQRPSPHRSLSQQFQPLSPVRRPNNDGTIDLTLDPVDVVAGRSIPRSRLNLEMGHGLTAGEIAEPPKQSTGATPTSKPPQESRGRPKLHAQFNVSLRPAQDAGKPMPLPPRPGQYTPTIIALKTPHGQAVGAKKDARPKPFTLEIPNVAPNFPPNGYADFNPWTGNHPEDQFSESVIRQGFYDKAQMTQNETGSAKGALFPSLKHKSGLQTLSSLFTSVMAQRRFHGQITSASTFKPPPRVTVTDTKREIWLKDLANSTIPLRRLSRSIPHGIRGKVLLDQSLSKNIPIERAVWLAKCVGANELRSFRRKGISGTLAMGGETKWIRDFTVCVEHFVEGVIATCGEADFKLKINYAIRLATHFHTEHLLDREHYLDWVISSLETAPDSKLPIWLLIAQVYWKDLLQHRKYGRRLATALVKHLLGVANPEDQDILGPLYNRLRELLKDVLIQSPDSFISPKIWLEYGEKIQAVYATEDASLKHTLRQLSARNRRLSKIESETDLSPRRQLLAALDSTLSTPFTTDLPRLCWKLDSDKDSLARTVLQWAVAKSRPGTENIFVAVRMLRSWNRNGLDVTAVILNFLQSSASTEHTSSSALYHIISELVRSEHFSVARYLEWLIARGGVYGINDIARGGPPATRLMVELPVHNVMEKTRELRTTLLSRAEYSVDDEEERVQSCLACISYALPNMPLDEEFDFSDVAINDDNVENTITSASWTTKSEIGLWLRHKVKLQIDHQIRLSLDSWSTISRKATVNEMSLEDFTTVKRYLLLTQDYSMLADVLKLVSSSTNPEILASCADTLNLRLTTFAAIGALDILFPLLVAHVNRFTDQLEVIPRVLLVALSDLAAELPEQKALASYLKQELVRSDRKTAADACSPVSDHMALMQTAESDFSDEIERILASGNSMDKGTLERLFQRIILRLEESLDKTPEQQRSCVLLLTRLKTFDVESFNVLLSTWVARFVQLRHRPSMFQILGPLVSFGCIALPEVVRILTSGSGNSDPRFFEEALSMILAIPSIPEAMSAGEVCRLAIKQSHLRQYYPREILLVVRRAIETTPAEMEQSRLRGPDMQDLLQRLVLANTDTVVQELIKPLLQKPEPAIISNINFLIDRLLLRDPSLMPITAETILDLADDLSLPFCQLKLATMFNTEDSAMVGADETPSTQLEAFNLAIESAVSSGRTSWSSIVPLLDVSIARHLRQRATTQFLAALPLLKNIIADNTMDLERNVAHAKDLLHIVNATAHSVTSSSSNVTVTSPVSDIPSALHNFWLILANHQVQPMHKNVVRSAWLPLIYQFTSAHRNVFENTKLGNENRGKTVITLAAICMELNSKIDNGEDSTILGEQIYDLALLLVDSLPDDVRNQCIRSLRDTASVAKMGYLFSITTNPSEWLVMVQRERLVASAQPVNVNTATSAGVESAKVVEKDKPMPYPLRRWEMLQEPTPNIGENDTSLSLTLFGARKG